MLITGGYNGNGDWLKSAEIYIPSGNTCCSLPELPSARGCHTQEGPWACGGYGYVNNTGTTCDKWSQGSWTQSHILRWGRDDHVSWATASGLYLMGGHYSGRTSELVKEDGSVEWGFKLEYWTE